MRRNTFVYMLLGFWLFHFEKYSICICHDSFLRSKRIGTHSTLNYFPQQQWYNEQALNFEWMKRYVEWYTMYKIAYVWEFIVNLLVFVGYVSCFIHFILHSIPFLHWYEKPMWNIQYSQIDNFICNFETFQLLTIFH